MLQLYLNDWKEVSPFEGASTEMILNEGDVRLVGSSDNKTGMVEIYHAGSWRRICAKSWSDKEADIVCRYMDLPFKGITQGTSFCKKNILNL